jgi:hypothetical protein
MKFSSHSAIYTSFFLFLGIFSQTTHAQTSSISIARLKYQGGGDWYSSKTALKNLALFCNQNLKSQIKTQEAIVEVSSEELFQYPYIFMTGHGNVVFSETEAENLRTYLTAGGFLHICDNYGMDVYIRREMKKVFPELEFKPVPFSHPVYHQKYDFNNGVPKIHEHEGKAAEGLGLFWKGKLVCFYDYESDLGNGWEDPELYNDPEYKRKLALQMGANLISFALLGK